MRLLSTRPHPRVFYQTKQESQMSLAMRHLIVKQSEEQARYECHQVTAIIG